MPMMGNQQFKVTFVNNLVDCDLALDLYIDGELVRETYLDAQEDSSILGIYKANSVLPFKFQELELVGASPPWPFFFVVSRRSRSGAWCPHGHRVDRHFAYDHLNRYRTF
jgi:hypothetical protein